MVKHGVGRRTVVVGGASSFVGLAVAAGCGDDGAAAGGGGSDAGTGPDASSSSGVGEGSTGARTDSSTSAGSTSGAPADGSSSGPLDDGAGSGTDTGSTGAAACDGQGWLAGGTAAMAGDYDNPFVRAPDPGCVVVGSQVCGPCWVTAPQRVDITTGYPGLPMQLWLRVVWEETCAPIEGAEVDVWFTDVDGVYSGQTPSVICSNGNPAATALDFMRGRQTTDAQGTLHFDANYPSWYPGRTPHIHVRIVVQGEQHYVTQLYFDDALSDGIYATHPDYDHRPIRDTNNAQDGGFDPGAPNYVSTAKTHDCAMQAWATVHVPLAAVAASC